MWFNYLVNLICLAAVGHLFNSAFSERQGSYWLGKTGTQGLAEPGVGLGLVSSGLVSITG